MLLIAAVLGAVIGAFLFSRQEAKYKAVSSFILEEKSAGAAGGLAGIASQFGISAGGLGGGGGIFAGDNILNILKSKYIIQKVLLSHIGETGSDSAKTIGDFYLEFTGLRKSWHNIPALANLNFTIPSKVITPIQDSVLNVIYENILQENLFVERAVKQGTIVKVQVTAPNSLFARLLTERIVSESGKLYTDIKTGTAQAHIDQLEKRADSLLYLLNRKSYTAAASQPLDVNPGLKESLVPGEISARDKSVLAALYAEVAKNLEMSKLLLSQQAPVIQLLDSPGYLLNDNKKGLLFYLIIYGFGVTAIFIFFNLALFVFRRN
jgi:hypothetical protein